MKYTVIRFIGGVTTSNTANGRTPLEGPNVFGFIRELDAPNEWAALNIANARFGAGDFELSERGVEFCEQLLAGSNKTVSRAALAAALARMLAREFFEDGLAADLHDRKLESNAEAYVQGYRDAVNELTQELTLKGGAS